jgi:glycine/D-amino acid oxidase-like deaminating enzyme
MAEVDPPKPYRYDTIIIGAGIVGSAIANYLSERAPGSRILVVDRCLGTELIGSTGCAGGFIGQVNDSAVLTRLAKDSVKEYKSLPSGFDTTGCVELASTEQGIARLHERLRIASTEYGLPAQLQTYEELVSVVPSFVKRSSFQRGLYFPEDGILDAAVVTSTFRSKASERGVAFEEMLVTRIDHSGGRVLGTNIATCEANSVRYASNIVLATGIWTPKLLLESQLDVNLVPIFPLAHPHVKSKPRPRRNVRSTPFVRWPEWYVYARDYGDRDGFGSYDHAPVYISRPSNNASSSWTDGPYRVAVYAACSGCVDHELAVEHLDPEFCQIGAFGMTPDNLPLIGPVDDLSSDKSRTWVAVGISLTHAAAAAKLLANLMSGKKDEVDATVCRAVQCDRFRGTEWEELLKHALKNYHGIYCLE